MEPSLTGMQDSAQMALGSPTRHTIKWLGWWPSCFHLYDYQKPVICYSQYSLLAIRGVTLYVVPRILEREMPYVESGREFYTLIVKSIKSVGENTK